MRSDRPLLFLIVAILCVLFFKFCACNLEETEHAVIYSFGQPLRVILHDESAPATGAGFVFKAPWHSVHRVESRIICAEPTPCRILTPSGEVRDLSYFCLWRINGPEAFLGRISSEANGNLLIEEVVGSKLSAEFQSKMTRPDAAAVERAHAAAAKELRAEGIDLLAVHVKELRPTAETASQVAARLVENYRNTAQALIDDAEQSAQAARAEADSAAGVALAAAEREAEATKTDMDAKVLQIRSHGFEYDSDDAIPAEKRGTKVLGSEADPEFFSFLQSLSALEKLPLDRSELVLKRDVLDSLIRDLHDSKAH